ncbi:CoA-transferase subunit beta [Calidifontibacillus oryziterrae]|uniref:CoA-transferase subunit beta n=1 Tax=Calidifontibacillus oryziterrae TaxID=1191699 RepID=UPI0002DA463F|nr:CoA-transferase [Calidifontibacillus oryziterrae]
MDYSTEELMVVAAAREIKDHEVVFVGMRLPILAFSVAKKTHAPNAIGLFEDGIIRDEPSAELLYTMGDPPNILGSCWCTSTNHLMYLMQQGYVKAGFIGGAEIDMYGNINTSYIGDFHNPKVKLPGSGGAADIASLSQRLLVIMNHEKKRLRHKVDYITSVGYGSGGSYRSDVGLPRGGVGALITNLGILRPDEETKELKLDSYHPGVTIEKIQAETGWELKAFNSVKETPPPTSEELAIIRSIDPQGFWTGRKERRAL